MFTELKNGPSQRKRKRIKTSDDGKTVLPMSPLPPVMAFSTSSSIVVLWADHLGTGIDRAIRNPLGKKGKMTHWESLAAVRHQTKSAATIGNLPCYCTPMRFRVRAKSTFGWVHGAQLAITCRRHPIGLPAVKSFKREDRTTVRNQMACSGM